MENNKLGDIICIDETSINALHIRQYCYNELGKRCTIKTQSQEVFKNILQYSQFPPYELSDGNYMIKDELIAIV